MAERSHAADDLAAELEERWHRVFKVELQRRALTAGAPQIARELTHTQLQTLRMLAGSSMRIGDLAERLGLAESSVTRLVDRLEKLGLVTRAPSTTDRRAVLVGLTARGRKFAAEMRAIRREFMRKILSTLSQRDRKELVRLFGHVADAFDEGGASGELSAVR